MQVGDRLPAVGADVGHDAIPGLAQPQRAGLLAYDPLQVPENRDVCLFERGERRDRFLGYDEKMDWGLGMHVHECHRQVIFIQDGGRYLFSQDLRENRLAHCISPFRQSFPDPTSLRDPKILTWSRRRAEGLSIADGFSDGMVEAPWNWIRGIASVSGELFDLASAPQRACDLCPHRVQPKFLISHKDPSCDSSEPCET